MPETTDAPVPETDAKAAEAKPTEAPAPAVVPVKEMKSIVLTGFGGVKMMKVQQKPEPSAGDGEVLIRVKACGMSFTDLMVRQGVIDHPPKTPVIMGFECAGIVEAVGANVTDFNVGDKVIAFSDYKAWSELVAVSANYVYKVGDNLSFHDGAALLMNFVVAYIILFDLAGVREGQSILAHSLGGGVGQAIIQLANTIPNVTIFGTASSHKHEAIKSKGNVAHLFDHNADYTQAIRKESSDGVDIVLDCLCGDDTNKGIALLRPMGKYILYGSSNIVSGETRSIFSFAKSLQLPDKMVWWQVDKVNPLKLFDDNKMIGGFQLRRLLFRQGHYEYVRKVVTRVLDLFNQGKIKPIIDSVWAFEDVGEAMQKLCDRKNIGKIILDPTAEPTPKSPEKKTAEATVSAEGAAGEEKKDALANGE
ncbi:synaptic vesicle membrane protein VAT-1 homolog-like isoform X2 [Biomphalaria glabrata]|uniref:Synaptic vesicle membrane protein VAT-1 homolog-like isoform X2 n=1 Tax=Biomphalaria glabrata TaxID=6526 RepID=A0A2C9KKR9_BIOGL|nr:synaptic vesicle membrane protein VAT-1 homolog-like isoform X2 [Biomphalaria glabrata]